jgi:intracellular septation protein A
MLSRFSIEKEQAMWQVDIIYWRLAAICFVVGLAFFFFTTDSLIRGKLRLPSWVFSIFTFVVGVFFFRIAVNSVHEFQMNRHNSLDELLDAYHMILNFLT